MITQIRNTGFYTPCQPAGGGGGSLQDGWCREGDSISMVKVIPSSRFSTKSKRSRVELSCTTGKGSSTYLRMRKSLKGELLMRVIMAYMTISERMLHNGDPIANPVCASQDISQE